MWLKMRKHVDLESKIPESFAWDALQSVKCHLQVKTVTWEWKLRVCLLSLINVAVKLQIDFFTEEISKKNENSDLTK